MNHRNSKKLTDSNEQSMKNDEINYNMAKTNLISSNMHKSN